MRWHYSYNPWNLFQFEVRRDRKWNSYQYAQNVYQVIWPTRGSRELSPVTEAVNSPSPSAACSANAETSSGQKLSTSKASKIILASTHEETPTTPSPALRWAWHGERMDWRQWKLNSRVPFLPAAKGNRNRVSHVKSASKTTPHPFLLFAFTVHFVLFTFSYTQELFCALWHAHELLFASHGRGISTRNSAAFMARTGTPATP